MNVLRTECRLQRCLWGELGRVQGRGGGVRGSRRIGAAWASAGDRGGLMRSQKRETWRWRTVTAAATSNNAVESNATGLVDELLTLVDGSDRGALLSQQERERLEHLIESLEQHCMLEPLLSPLIFGEWDVVYSSNPTATGGYYRSAVGRTLLNTKQMMQIVKEPDFVSNKVSFAALGVVDGEVSLKGKLEALDKRWLKITFDSPDLKLDFGPYSFSMVESAA